MIPGKLDLPTIWRGCDWGPITLKWKGSTGDPLNLSQWRPLAQSLNIDLNPLVLPQNVQANIGVTTLQLSKEETANLKLGTESWDWIWEHNRNPPDIILPPFLYGKVTIKEPVTKLNGSAHTPAPPSVPPST